MDNTSDRKNAEQREAAFEDAIATRYNRDYHESPIATTHTESFVRYVASQYRAGDRVLDLGCAAASLWPSFEKHFKAPGVLVGVDLSPRMIEEAKKRFPNGDFRVGSMFDIPSNPGEFDLVIVSSAFHHIADKHLPAALKDIHRVLDEHGRLVGREPLCVNRVGDRGGWLAGALMNLRHMVYRLTHTREYPEPDPGPDHHAYDAKTLVDMLNATFLVEHTETRHPVSPFFSRVNDEAVSIAAHYLDEALDHKEGQELYYVASKNYADADEVKRCVRLALEENRIEDIEGFLAKVQAAAGFLDKKLSQSEPPTQ